MSKPKDKIDPNKIKTRDWALVDLINGACKGGAHTDQKKKRNKNKCRTKVTPNSED